MENSFLDIDIKLFRKLFPFISYNNLGNDFFIADLYYSQNLDSLKYPLRFNGYFALFCMKGSLIVDLNLSSYELKEQSLLVYTPYNILRLRPITEEELNNSHYILIAVSQDYLSKINVDFNQLHHESLGILNQPCIELNSEEILLCHKYLDIIHELMKTNFKVDIIASLLGSFFYLIANIWMEKLKIASQKTLLQNSEKPTMIFKQFIKLITEYHTKERNMSFYAQKLYLTPKYLSKLIKKVSGRSGPEWIDDFIILESKSMLKHSSLSIKEIVFQLNFSNEPSFYKFFKNKTGMTPCEYRNS